MKKVLVYGVGDNFILNSEFIKSKFEIIGYVDGNPKKKGKFIDGIMIDDIESISSYEFDELLVTPNAYPEIVFSLIKAGISREKIVLLHSLLDVEPIGNHLKVLFSLSGRFEDILINVNYIWCFICKFSGVKADIYLGDKVLFAEFNKLMPCCDDCKLLHEDGKDENLSLLMLKYDLVIQVDKYPTILKSDMVKIAYMHPDMVDLLIQYEKFKIFNPRFFDKSFESEGISALYEVNNGRTRIKQPDIYGLLGISEEYKCPLKTNVDLLNSYDLNNKKYITIHRGCSKKAYGSIGTKIWSSDRYESLMAMIKVEYPDYRVVLLGEEYEKTSEVKSYDYDLLGQTDIIELGTILKYSSLHIDTDGGLVHLRHAVHGGMSIVLFGSTSEEFFGYSENVNIRTDACRLPCERTHMQWDIECNNRNHQYICMDSIKSEMVMREIRSNWKD